MKRAFLIALLALVLTGDGRAASTVDGTRWTCSLDDKADTPSLCISAPGSGLRLYVTDVVAQNTTSTAGFFQLYHGRSVATGGTPDCGGDSALATNMLPSGTIGTTPPTRFVAAGNTVEPTFITFGTPLIVPKDRDFCVEGDPNNTFTIQVSGFVAP